MKFAAELHGGIFDGDAGAWQGTELPACIWATGCSEPGCRAGGVHWTPEPFDGRSVKYVFSHRDERRGVAIYYHGDVDYDDILGRSENLEV